MADFLTPDLCVIGAGASGIATAEAARAYGASVILVERDRLGGTALNTGALPARALAAAAAQASLIRTAPPFGISVEGARINFRKVHDHLEQVVATTTPQSAAARLQAQGIEIVPGEARFIDKKTVAVGEVQIRARRFVIATGSRPSVAPIPGLDSVPYFTTDTILDNTRKLTHLVIIGAGATGLELAQAYNRLGTQVTLVEHGMPLEGTDLDLAAVALRRLEEEGVAIRTRAEVTAIQARSMGIGVAVRTADGEERLDVSHVLVASPRIPNLESLDLAKAGIQRLRADPTRIQVSRGLKTSNARVYAVGDAAGGSQSMQGALRQAQVVVRGALLVWPTHNDPLLVPRVVYTDPEIAEVGLSEATARTRHGIRFRVTRWNFADNDLARARRQTFGLAKLITDRSGRIIGAGVAGPGAGELIALFSLAMASGISARDLGKFVAPDPSLSQMAMRLGAEFLREDAKNPWVQRWVALNRWLG